MTSIYFKCIRSRKSTRESIGLVDNHVFKMCPVKGKGCVNSPRGSFKSIHRNLFLRRLHLRQLFQTEELLKQVNIYASQ